MTDTALVLLNYNDPYTTLEAARRASGYKCIGHIIIADNASTDDSTEVIGRALKEGKNAFPGTDLIRNRRNGGYGYGNNRAVRYAHGRYNARYVLIANPDSVFDEELVRDMLKVFDANKEAACVGAVMELSGGSAVPTYNEFMRSGWMERNLLQELIASGPLLKRLFGRYVNYSYKYYISMDPVPVYAVHGSLLMVDAEKFLECGGYDEDIFLYEEEYVLGAKLKERGYLTYLIKKKYRHEGSHSITGAGHGAYRRQQFRAASEMVYYRKYLHAGRMWLAAARLMQGIVLLETRLFLRGQRVWKVAKAVCRTGGARA